MTATEIAAWNKKRAKKSEMRAYRKRCDRCQKAGYYKRAERRCRFITSMLGTWTCGGQLTPAPLTRQPKVVPAVLVQPNGALLTSLDRRSVQAKAYQRAQIAERQVEKILARIRRSRKPSVIIRAATSLRLWQRRAVYFSKRARLTNEEIAEQQTLREARAAERAAARKIRRRAMMVKGS